MRASIDEAVAAIVDGRPVVVSGSDGDLVFAAEHATRSWWRSLSGTPRVRERRTVQ